MFGMGFMEIFLIAVIAIITLGPEKLPSAMIDVAKFFKNFKSGIEDAKSTLDKELNINEMKEESRQLRAQVQNIKSSVNITSDLNLNDIMNDDLLEDDTKKIKKNKNKKDKINQKKTKKQNKEQDKEAKKNLENKDTKINNTQNNINLKTNSDKFKVNVNIQDKKNV